MKKTKDTNKGITLIALVITIIVMLILVAVTITMAVKGGLFEYAGRAGSETNTKRDAEQEYANLQPDMTYDELIDKYTGLKEEGGSTTCKKCVDGYITGYVCSNYNDDCFVVNEGYTEVDSDTVQLSECLHYQSLKNVYKGEYLCPDCSIRFSINGNNYSVLKGSTWEEAFGDNMNWSVDGNYVRECGGTDYFVHYTDGTRVKPTDEIRSRICLYARFILYF